MANAKRPVQGQMVSLGKGLNPVAIAAVYDGVTMHGETAVYSVKVASGDMYDVIAYNEGWQAIR